MKKKYFILKCNGLHAHAVITHLKKYKSVKTELFFSLTEQAHIKQLTRKLKIRAE